ncbi:MAG: efflux RND transporter periplasmic adaptor subunit [Proteobacteria bacterium]|nr:efflux RND transporter periplasmic adaptor subunit [Pseudomonadota bacterium]
MIREPIKRLIVATGTIEPQKEVEVRPRIAGIVERIAVEAGDWVEADQVLVEIERDLLEAQLREADAAVEAAEVERRFAEIERRRAQDLQDRGATATRVLDDARARFETSVASLARARANRDRLATQLRYATIRAPLAGRVLNVPVEEGNAVSPVTAVTGGTLLLSIAATKSLHLEGLVDESEIPRVAVGQTAEVRTEAFGERAFAGQVRDISPVGNRVQNVTYFEVEVEIVDPEASLLKPRMSGDADIVAEVVPDALTVPESALRYRGERIYVNVVTGDEAQPRDERDVEIGIVNGSRVQVLSGLAEGERVEVQ